MSIRRAAPLVVTMLLVMGALHPASAGAAMLGTAAAWEMTSAPTPEELTARLEQLGVTHEAARVRVAALTASERRDLAHRLDQLPAGGDVLGALAFAALVLLLTDILGYTDVYSFVTHTINGEKRSSSLQECIPTAPTAAVAP